MKEIPEPVFTCLIYHSECGTDEQHKRQPTSENWRGINSLQVSFCCTADALEVGRCRSYGREDSWFISEHFKKETCVFSSQTFATKQSRDKSQNRGEQSKGLQAVSQILRGRSRRLHRWGGVAHHVVVVRRRAVTLQTGVQGRVVQTEVQRGHCGWELLLLCVAQHRLFALTHCLHPGNTKRYSINMMGNISTQLNSTQNTSFSRGDLSNILWCQLLKCEDLILFCFV